MLVGAVAVVAVGWDYADEILRPPASAADPADPGEAFFFSTEQVVLDGPHAALPAEVVIPDVVAPDDERTAWRTGGPRDTWAVLIPARGAARGDAFRIVPILRELGVPAVVLGHRNEHDMSTTSNSRAGSGWMEWREVAAATEYAFARGASDVILVGDAMGGATVASYLRRSDHADRVVGAVLDAPVLDWGPALRAAVGPPGVPRWLGPVTQVIILLRTDLRWSDLDHVARADAFETPLLVFHGTADATVPVRSSDAFATARPDLVTYVRVEGAGHLGAWNAGPDAYGRHLRTFITGLLD